jgi:hypothetical protein
MNNSSAISHQDVAVGIQSLPIRKSVVACLEQMASIQIAIGKAGCGAQRQADPCKRASNHFILLSLADTSEECIIEA